MKSKTR